MKPKRNAPGAVRTKNQMEVGFERRLEGRQGTPGKNLADKTTKGEDSASENRKGSSRDRVTASNAGAVSVWQNADCCIFARGEKVGRDTGRQRTVCERECVHISVERR